MLNSELGEGMLAGLGHTQEFTNFPKYPVMGCEALGQKIREFFDTG